MLFLMGCSGDRDDVKLIFWAIFSGAAFLQLLLSGGSPRKGKGESVVGCYAGGGDDGDSDGDGGCGGCGSCG